eukprot:Opistho-2@96023
MTLSRDWRWVPLRCLLWENLEVNRYTMKNASSGETATIHLTREQEKDRSHFVDETGADLELVEKISFLEWLANNYKKFGAVLEIVTDKSQEGSQFCKGFGGIGGLLRYRVDFQTMDVNEDDYIDDLDDFM